MLKPGRGQGRGRGHVLEKVAYTKTNLRHTHDLHTSWLTGDSQSQSPGNALFEFSNPKIGIMQVIINIKSNI